MGRADDLIKTRGYRVGPFKIENVLMKHPAVLECAVIGVPDEMPKTTSGKIKRVALKA